MSTNAQFDFMILASSKMLKGLEIKFTSRRTNFNALQLLRDSSKTSVKIIVRMPNNEIVNPKLEK